MLCRFRRSDECLSKLEASQKAALSCLLIGRIIEYQSQNIYNKNRAKIGCCTLRLFSIFIYIHVLVYPSNQEPTNCDNVPFLTSTSSCWKKNYLQLLTNTNHDLTSLMKIKEMELAKPSFSPPKSPSGRDRGTRRAHLQWMHTALTKRRS
jgi:hypothetical protein